MIMFQSPITVREAKGGGEPYLLMVPGNNVLNILSILWGGGTYVWALDHLVKGAAKPNKKYAQYPHFQAVLSIQDNRGSD